MTTTPHANPIEDQAAEWKEELDGQLEEVRENLAAGSEAVIDFIKEKPVLCLAGALAAGYLLGRLVRR
jgi:hypothetical protein